MLSFVIADEGQKPVFDRDEINSWTAPDSEKRSVNLLRDKDVSDRRRQQPERERQDVRDRSPLGRADRMASSRDQQRTSVKDRLGVAAGGDRKSTGQVRDRLGEREGVLEDTERMLDREEMESRRPNTRPWDINPEYVPRGRNYYEVGTKSKVAPVSEVSDERGSFFFSSTTIVMRLTAAPLTIAAVVASEEMAGEEASAQTSATEETATAAGETVGKEASGITNEVVGEEAIGAEASGVATNGEVGESSFRSE